MRYCIHRGTKEIGGTAIELEAEGQRIVLDLGLPLDADAAAPALLPPIPGLLAPDPSLLAVVLSHGHRDHWGLLPLIRPDIPLVLGRETEAIMRAAADFVPGGFAPTAWRHLQDREPLTVGPFRITPHLVDHSGFDAYALEIEAGGRRLFYSGDLRAHGRKAALFERMLRAPPRDVDVMLMEGSSLGRLDAAERFPTEAALEEAFIARFRDTPGMALVCCSAQNIDRVVTVYRAAKRTGRTLVVDAYAAAVLKATGRDSIPKPAPGWPKIAVYLPQAQRVHMVKAGIAPQVDAYRGFRIWPKQLAGKAPELAMIVRPWMLRDLAANGSLAGGGVIWSQWEGYLADGPGAAFRAECSARGLPFEVIHTSGHASVADLQRLASAIAPSALVPIHTFEGWRFRELFGNVVTRNDGEWGEV